MLKYAVKIKSQNDHPTNSVYTEHWTKYYGKSVEHNFYVKTSKFFKECNINFENLSVNVLNYAKPPKPPWIGNVNYNVDISLSKCGYKKTNENEVSFLKLLSLDLINSQSTDTCVFTDASKLEYKAAASFHIKNINFTHSIRLSDNTSVFLAELAAIYSAIEHIIKHSNSFSSKNISIFTDSLSVLKALENKQNDLPEIYMLKSAIQTYTNHHFNFIWIPSHINIPQNELVDKAAKIALHNNKITDVDILNLSNIFDKINSYILNKWQNHYDEKLDNHIYKLLENKVSFKSKYNCNQRKELVTISRLRLGYSKVNNTLFKWKQHPTGKCNYCDCIEDIEHFLINCPM